MCAQARASQQTGGPEGPPLRTGERLARELRGERGGFFRQRGGEDEVAFLDRLFRLFGEPFGLVVLRAPLVAQLAVVDAIEVARRLLKQIAHLTLGVGISRRRRRPQLASRLPWHDAATPHPHLNDADDWWAAMRRLFLGAYLRAGVAEEPARRAVGGFRDHYLDPAHWSVFPDSAAALDRLSAAGYQHMIVSNHVPELLWLVSALGLADHFDEVLTSASVGFEKPHPGIFRCALERAGSPRIAHMVGDNPTADVQGARAVGLPAILVRGPNGVSLADAATEILGGR